MADGPDKRRDGDDNRRTAEGFRADGAMANEAKSVWGQLPDRPMRTASTDLGAVDHQTRVADSTKVADQSAVPGRFGEDSRMPNLNNQLADASAMFYQGRMMYSWQSEQANFLRRADALVWGIRRGLDETKSELKAGAGPGASSRMLSLIDDEAGDTTFAQQFSEARLFCIQNVPGFGRMGKEEEGHLRGRFLMMSKLAESVLSDYSDEKLLTRSEEQVKGGRPW